MLKNILPYLIGVVIAAMVVLSEIYEITILNVMLFGLFIAPAMLAMEFCVFILLESECKVDAIRLQLKRKNKLTSQNTQ